MSQPFYLKKIAVLGAGVMGAQIAAHFVNAGITTFLYDLPTPNNENLNSLVSSEIKNLNNIQPPPLTLPENVIYIQAANYAQDLERLKECDLVIEAISERLDIKLDLYKKIAPYIGANTIFASNTSGLSINKLAQSLPGSCRPRFLGMHFFNPPRYMKLVELIPSTDTDLQLLAPIETFLVSVLGKGVVYAKDSPNFVANRIGIFSLLMTMHHAAEYNIGLDIVDALTGPLIGRPKSATFRTMDVVGLDTMAHAVQTMTDGLKNDPWHKYFYLPDWLNDLIKKGALGQKNRWGVYKKQQDQIMIYDLSTKDYRPATGQISDEIKSIFATKNFTEIFTKLKASQHPEAQFLWACFRDVFHYSAYHLISITSTVRDADFAMRWGFGWQQGPFELWQNSGWELIRKFLQDDIDNKHSTAVVALPDWVQTNNAVYTKEGAYAPESKVYLPRKPLPVYERQLYPEHMPEEVVNKGFTLFENNSVRVWHTGDEIAILSFKTKLGTIDDELLDGMATSVTVAEKLGRGLILWTDSPQFSAGANLRNILTSAQNKKINNIELMLENFQRATIALKYSAVPTVAAVRGYVLGGGCEAMLHCTRVIAALESTIGLVEASIGLVPAGGGCAVLVQQAWQELPADPYPLLEKYYLQVVAGFRPTNAAVAMQAHYLQTVDKITFNPYELLYLAKQQVSFCKINNYRPALVNPVGSMCTNDYRERLFSAWQAANSKTAPTTHDEWIAREIAHIFGSQVTETAVNIETELHRRERESFIALVKSPATQERIEYMLNTGKIKRN